MCIFRVRFFSVEGDLTLESLKDIHQAVIFMQQDIFNTQPKIISLLKESNPSLYETFKVRKMTHLNEKLEELRRFWRMGNEKQRADIEKQATKVKEDIEYYKSIL